MTPCSSTHLCAMYCLLTCGYPWPHRLAWGSSECPRCDPRRLCCSSLSQTMFLMPASVPSKCSNVSSILPTQAPSSQLGSTLLDALVHQTCRCCHHLACRRSASNHRVQCFTWSAKQRDGPTTQSRDVSAEDSRFPPPEPTCVPQRFHGKLECTLRLVPGSGGRRADRALAESGALARSQSPLTSEFVAGSPSGV